MGAPVTEALWIEATDAINTFLTGVGLQKRFSLRYPGDIPDECMSVPIPTGQTPGEMRPRSSLSSKTTDIEKLRSGELIHAFVLSHDPQYI